jgi:xanthine dehydrogenase large subunit
MRAPKKAPRVLPAVTHVSHDSAVTHVSHDSAVTHVSHDSAVTHVTGKSEFVDDRPLVVGEVFVGLVLSERAHAEFQFENAAELRNLPGIRALYFAADFPHNLWGTIFQDQPLLADKIVRYHGEALAIVAADTEEALAHAKEQARVRYQDLPAILSIDEARKHGSFLGAERKIERGDVEKALKKAPHVLEGEIEIAGAEHFYLEPQAALATPQEQGRLHILSSSQHPTEVQHVVSHGLGLESKDVVVEVKRMGGGFGGKESQSAPIAAYAALVAHKLNRTARIVLNREEDMAITGKRNPFKDLYRVGFDEKGKILALDLQLFSDAGAYADLSTSIMERAMLHSDSAYYIANMRVVGKVCRTNYHPHTAFRGFGAPKGVLALERIIEEMGHRLRLDPLRIRMLNCYQGKKNITHYGQVVENNCLPELFRRLEKSSQYKKRRGAISAFNATSIQQDSALSRGLSLTPVKFGISFTTRFLNQGNALINIYRDGSVQVSTGATEMGQGAYRRISQVVAEELGVDLGRVRVMSTSTEKNANTSPTAASSGTDINGAAAALACQQIKARLSEFAVKLLKLDPKRWASLTAPIGTEEESELNAITHRKAFWTFPNILVFNLRRALYFQKKIRRNGFPLKHSVTKPI